MSFVRACTTMLVFGGIILSSNVRAHDVWAIGNPKFPPEAKVNEADILRMVNAAAPLSDARYIFQRTLLWRPASTLKGCFIAGSLAERDAVAAAAKSILDSTGANLKIDFGDHKSSCTADAKGYYSEDIRVSFQDGCCSAFVGTTARSRFVFANGYVIAKNPSVFLQGGQPVSTIKHELLHAIGFHHEHQKPASGCGFDYAAIAKAYNWSMDTVKQNFDAIPASSSYVMSSGFDRDSIMKYYFDPNLLAAGKKSPCYSAQAEDLSDFDRLGVQTAYPANFDQVAHDAHIGHRGIIAISGANAFLKDIIRSQTQ